MTNIYVCFGLIVLGIAVLILSFFGLIIACCLVVSDFVWRHFPGRWTAIVATWFGRLWRKWEGVF